MKLVMLISLLSAANAEFDNCDRANGEWIGFDQGTGQSRGYAATTHGQNIYIAGSMLGNFSFATKHVDGNYHVVGKSTADHHDTHDTVINHHFTNSGGNRVGMDLTIVKVSEAGEPDAIVFAADLVPHGQLVDNKTSVRTYGYMSGIASFPAIPGVVAAVGSYVGDLTVPMANGNNKMFANPKFSSWDYNGIVVCREQGMSRPQVAEAPIGIVVKVDMDTGKALWATSEGMTSPAGRQYGSAVATTASGHVIAIGYARNGAGRVAKYDGATGSSVWMKDFEELYISQVDIVGETAFVSGEFTGAGVTKYGGNLTSCKDGEDASAFIASFDVSSSTNGPATNWMKLVGCGEGKAVTISGDSLFVAGELKLEKPSALTPATGVGAATCTLAGNLTGYLVKLNKDGTCVWAKDTAEHERIATDGTHVWAASRDDDPVKFSAALILSPEADDDQIFGVKYDAADGVALWVERLGGSGSSRISDMIMTPTGPLMVAYSESEGVTVGDVTANNLQHARASAVKAAAGLPPTAQAGDQALLVIQLSKTDKKPSCITTCASGKIDQDTVVASGSCYADGICLADGEFSPGRPCFQCKTAVSQIEFKGPILDNHCYIAEICRKRGEGAPTYARYGDNSVCEACNPDKKTDGWSLQSGFFHDRDTADQRNEGANDYGLYFASRSNGCQLLPSMPAHPAPSAGFTAANVNPTVGTVAAIAARTKSAIAGVNGASKDNQGAEIAWAYYHGDSSKCIKSADMEDVCKMTPSELSDKLAKDFETDLYYGHSVSRVKVQQVLSILQSDMKTPSEDRSIADLKADIVSHMLIPHYQGAIKAAHLMDEGLATAQADGAEHWKVINEAIVSNAFAASDRAQLSEMFASPASGKLNFCTVKELLLRNLPGGSDKQYGSIPFLVGGEQGCTENCNTIKTFTKEESDAKHVTAKDVGVLKVTLQTDGSQKDCSVLAMPPPSPPPVKVAPKGGATVVLTMTASGSVSDYSDDDKSSMQQKFANAAGVDKSLVTVAVTAASVIITVTIAVPATTTASTVQKSLSTNFGTADDASAMLGVTVESAPTMIGTEVKQETSEDPGLSDGEIAGVAIGAGVGGIVVLGIMALVIRSLMFKGAKPVFTCLEKSPAEKTAAPAV